MVPAIQPTYDGVISKARFEQLWLSTTLCAMSAADRLAVLVKLAAAALLAAAAAATAAAAGPFESSGAKQQAQAITHNLGKAWKKLLFHAGSFGRCGIQRAVGVCC